MFIGDEKKIRSSQAVDNITTTIRRVLLIEWFVRVYETKPRAVSEWLSFVHTDEPYNKLLIALLASCTLCVSGYLTLNT